MDGRRTEGHPGKKKFARGHISVRELFKGIEVTTNFYRDIQIKDSIFYRINCFARTRTMHAKELHMKS